MKKNTLITDHFLLNNRHAEALYHEYAAGQPIIDYHCHLSPADIAADRRFDNLTEIWLEGDHYKWRAMRTLGIDEEYITGDAPPRDKFRKWAETVPATVRNPLFHWTHLELKRYFGIDTLLTPDNADEVYTEAGRQLKTPEFTVRSLLKKMNVEVVCTTDDPADSLEHHRAIAEDDFSIKILPTFRPDNAYSFSDPEHYNRYLDRLGEAAKTEITQFDDLVGALVTHIDRFHEQGCRLADHGMERLYYAPADHSRVSALFDKIRSGDPLETREKHQLTYAIQLELCRYYHKKGWAQQFHLGALRDTNDRMRRELGADAGFDSIGDFRQAESMAGFFNALDRTGQLARTIIYNLNPADNAVFATMTGNFNDGSVRGKMQYGSGWWYLDQKDGMEDQINTLSNMGLLSCFVGMLTDSRSFLSYPRHEYFRRVLCNLFGEDIERGELPDDREWIGGIITDICYRNARSYFNF